MMYIKLLVLVFLHAPMALLAQAPEGRWHLISFPQVLLAMGDAHIVFTITKDSLITSFEPTSATDSVKVERRGRQRNERMKIVSRYDSQHGDTTILMVREGKKEHTAFRLVAESAERRALSVADDLKGKNPKLPPDADYEFFGTAVTEAEYHKLRKLKDAATITKDEYVFILKNLREAIVNMKARGDYERRMSGSHGFPLLFELGQRVATDLEALGYSPVHFSRSVEEISEQFKDDPQVKQIMDEMPQLMKD